LPPFRKTKKRRKDWIYRAAELGYPGRGKGRKKEYIYYRPGNTETIRRVLKSRRPIAPLLI